MAKGTRYYLSEDDPIGATPSQLKRLGREKQLAYMRAWFETYYEDPSNETPRQDNEFVYPWGGPYDASDALQSEFGDIVKFERIEEAIRDVGSDGTFDWAPTHQHPDYIKSMDYDADPDEAPPDPTIAVLLRRLRNGEPIRFGTPEELAARLSLRERADALGDALARFREAPPGRGHNRPPPDEDENGSEPTLAEAESAVVEIKTQLDLLNPDPERVAEATSLLSRLGNWWSKRIEKTIERAVVNAILGTAVAAVAAAGGFVADRYIPGGLPLVHQLEASAIHWLISLLP